MKDYFAVLGVEQTADDATIKAAYRKLAKEYHPDTNKATNAEAKFQEINEAYEAIKDEGRRAQLRRPQPQPRSSYSWNDTHYSQRDAQQSSTIDLDEILRDIRRSRSSPFGDDAKNRDIVLSYTITLEEAFTGKDASLKYNIAGKPAQQEVNFKVPQGVNDGTKLRFQGKGDDAMKHVAAGDLYIKITIMPHHTFVRMGQNLVTSTSIDYLDALLGTEKEIPTIEGKKIMMRVPPGILPGQSLRAGGKGMLANGKRGDMMVEVTFQPITLTVDQQDLIHQARAKRT